MNILRKCNLCCRNCLVDRYKEKGYCNASNKIKVSLVSLHQWEEPFISGTRGSGTIFFSHCSLKCIFCQNKKISDGYGKEITIKRFSKICLEQQQKGAHNINLVTPTHYVPLIRKGLIKAKKEGLKIPIVYNTSSYDSITALQMMDGLVDIYLADLKYYSDLLAKKYSKCSNYFENATKAIEEMYKQVGKPIIENNLLKKGVVVRILILPDNIIDSKKIIKYLYNKYGDNIYLSIMNQYTPISKYKYNELNRKLTEEEYNEVIDYACSIGVKNAFIQEGDTALESFIPEFDLTNV